MYASIYVSIFMSLLFIKICYTYIHLQVRPQSAPLFGVVVAAYLCIYYIHMYTLCTAIRCAIPQINSTYKCTYIQTLHKINLIIISSVAALLSLNIWYGQLGMCSAKRTDSRTVGRTDRRLEAENDKWTHNRSAATTSTLTLIKAGISGQEEQEDGREVSDAKWWARGRWAFGEGRRSETELICMQKLISTCLLLGAQHQYKQTNLNVCICTHI